MSTKLTLTVDGDVIDSAKEYARKHKRSLSNIIEEYLKSLTGQSKQEEKPDLSAIVKELKGSVRDPNPDKSYKELLADSLVDKHLR